MSLKDRFKNAVKSAIRSGVNLGMRTRAGVYAQEQVITQAMSRLTEVHHDGLTLRLSTPNFLCAWRARSFSVKEPETLEWIDAFPEGAVLWDIGANVGLYACYAAKRRGCRVFAFEPSVFNLELLARNIHANGLTDRITIVPLPLSDELSVSKLNMTSTQWGGAMSTFGEEYGHDGKPLLNPSSDEGEALLAAGKAQGHLKVFEFSTLGISMDQAVKLLGIAQPEYIKMDVDGIEHLILSGGTDSLQRAKGVLIEINDSFSTQADQASAYLRQAGFSLKEKRHADEFSKGEAVHTFNQIWVRA